MDPRNQWQTRKRRRPPRRYPDLAPGGYRKERDRPQTHPATSRRVSQNITRLTQTRYRPPGTAQSHHGNQTSWTEHARLHRRFWDLQKIWRLSQHPQNSGEGGTTLLHLFTPPRDSSLSISRQPESNESHVFAPNTADLR